MKDWRMTFEVSYRKQCFWPSVRLHDILQLESSSHFFGEGKKTELFGMLTVTVLCSYGSVNGDISPSTILR